MKYTIVPARWVHRSRGYTMSPAAARKFEAEIAALAS
jgi:hypothetical protein